MKIAIISSEDFEPVYMVKNYIYFIERIYRPFSYYDPEYDEHITFITGLDTLIDSVASVKASMDGFAVEAITNHIEPDEFKRNQILIDDADRIAIFWDGKNDIVKDTIEYALSCKKDIEIYFDKKE